MYQGATQMTIKQEIGAINAQTAAIRIVREELEDELAELEADEPQCECTQTDVDEYDASYCEYHRGDSDYNRNYDRLKAAIAQLDRKPAAETNERKVA
jgi:hypothetical protein